MKSTNIPTTNNDSRRGVQLNAQPTKLNAQNTNQTHLGVMNQGVKYYAPTTRPTRTRIRIFAACIALAVLALTGCSAPVKQTSYEYKFPAWTNDGKILAIKRTITTWRSGGGYDGTNSYDLVVFDDDGSNERKITSVPSDAGFISCSTSGNYIGYAVDNYIRVIDWSGNVSFNIGTGSNTGDGQKFDWSPDEKKIVFYNNDSISVFDVINKTNLDIASLSIDQSWKYNSNFVFRKQNNLAFSDQLGNVSTENVDLYNRCWPQYLNGQNKIAYFDNNGKIYYYDLNTTQITSANIGLADAEYYVPINHLGTKLAYGKLEKNIYVMDINGANNKQIK